MQTPFGQVIPLASHTKDGAHAEAAQLAMQGMTGLWIIQSLHDDFCKCAQTQDERDCHPKCKPDYILMSLEAHASLMQFDARMRKAGSN
jgi:hypothetical protein